MYLIVWSERNGHTVTDRWTVEETLTEATRVYERILADSSTWTVSICVPIQSTDYTPVDQIAEHILYNRHYIDRGS